MPHDPIEEALLANGGALLAEVARDESSTPIPLAGEPQSFPAKLLPGALGEFAESLSAHTETPRELAALMSMAVTSASVAGRYQVEIREGYAEPLNLFVAAALESGNRKTAVVGAARRPLIDFEREQQELMAPERRIAISERKTLEARIEKLRKEVANEECGDAKARLRELEQSLIEIPEFRDPPGYR
jgi:putative DNA primase/helicase